MKQITDICELFSPRLLATCSLDGKIKLWELTDDKQTVLKTALKDPGNSIRGIRGLSYMYDYGSNLLSFGFENHINVWCPELSLKRPFIG